MLNKVQVIGYLGNDPETRYTQSGTAVTEISVATSEKWKDKDGNPQEHTEWHKVVFWGKLAEIAGEYLKKGRLVYVDGTLRTEKWTDKDGNDRWTTKIKSDEMKMLGGGSDREDRGGGGGGGGGGNRSQGAPSGGQRREPPTGAEAYGRTPMRDAPKREGPPPKQNDFADDFADDDVPF